MTMNAMRHLDRLRIIAACAVVWRYSDHFKELPISQREVR
jgi:hypothetical protein